MSTHLDGRSVKVLDGVPCLVMPALLPLLSNHEVVESVIDGLQKAADNAGFVHNDVSRKNIMRVPGGGDSDYVLIDFHLAEEKPLAGRVENVL